MTPLKRWRRATDLFKATDPKASLLQISAFIEIASQPDEAMSQSELAQALGKVPTPMVHEVVGRLGRDTKPRFGQPLGLIDIKTDPEDARTNRLSLTLKGRNLAMAMLAALKERG
jgi:DNA-binding MarR family transcriptional regulator